MITFAPRPGAGALVAAPGQFDTLESDSSTVRTEDPTGAVVDFPAWSTLSWEERADYVARYCL